MSKPSFSNKNQTSEIRRRASVLQAAQISTSRTSEHAKGTQDVENPSFRVTRTSLVKFFVILSMVSILLRIFYSTHLYQDDGFWFSTAEEILRGKALYREIYFDKPLLLPLTYALLFKLFGTHILTIRLFTALYCVAIAWVLYRFGSMLYDKQIGLISAAMFVLFSTTYTTGHVQSLSTDLLMLLPYTAGAWLLVRSAGLTNRVEDRARPYPLAWAGGALVGVAFQANPKAIFDLIFYGVIIGIVATKSRVAARKIVEGGLSDASLPAEQSLKRRLLLSCSAILGLVSASIPFLTYLGAERALTEYWHFVWVWGARYVSYHSPFTVFVSAVRQSIGYFALNGILLISLIVVSLPVITALRKKPLDADKPARRGEEPSNAGNPSYSDVVLLIWFATSYVGLAVGGRFFGHYFLQIVPSLCLIGARGLMIIRASMSIRSSKPRSRPVRAVVAGALILGLTITLVRFHARTAVLAIDWVRGTKSEMTADWYHDRLNRVERIVAAEVRDLHETEESLERMGVEAIRKRDSYDQAGDEPADYLFVWGYRPEIYYWSGLRPASRYLSTQPLTGIPADIHYFELPHQLLLNDQESAQARAQLVNDLEQTTPKYIIDELGAFNWDLSITKYPELREFMKHYKFRGQSQGFTIYRHRNFAPRERKTTETTIER